MSHRAFDGYVSAQTANGIDGYSTVIRAQSATGLGSNGGDIILASGKGVNRDGYIKLDTDGYERLIISSSVTTLGLPNLLFDGYQNSPLIKQNNQVTNGVDGYSFSIKAQSSTSSPAYGGSLLLKSGDGYNGDGYFRDGYVKLYSGETEQARVVPNKFYMMTGQRVRIDNISTTPFDITDGYFILAVDTSGGAKVINLPATPLIGDLYQIKDKTGNAAANTITINGNGNNIDSSSSYLINANYGTVILVFNGTSWSVL
jgi:hypothetical protein